MIEYFNSLAKEGESVGYARAIGFEGMIDELNGEDAIAVLIIPKDAEKVRIGGTFYRCNGAHVKHIFMVDDERVQYEKAGTDYSNSLTLEAGKDIRGEWIYYFDNLEDACNYYKYFAAITR